MVAIARRGSLFLDRKVSCLTWPAGSGNSSVQAKLTIVLTRFSIIGDEKRSRDSASTNMEKKKKATSISLSLLHLYCADKPDFRSIHG